MPKVGTIFRALVASPSDCVHERKIIPEVLAAWNAVHSLSSAAIIEPVLWETHARPEFGNRPQALINQQLVEHCDIVIGAFWTNGGASFREFWDTGDSIIAAIKQEIPKVREMANGAQQSAPADAVSRRG